jgi:hypothetical protein
MVLGHAPGSRQIWEIISAWTRKLYQAYTWGLLNYKFGLSYAHEELGDNKMNFLTRLAGT